MNPRQTEEIRPIIRHDANYDFMGDPAPQWPYLLAQVAKEREDNPERALLKLVVLVGRVKSAGEFGATSPRFSCGRFDNEWSLEIADFMQWEHSIKEVL